MLVVVFALLLPESDGFFWGRRRRRRRRRCPSAWTQWGSCSVSCGRGVKTRTQVACGGNKKTQTTHCGTPCCKVNCVWGKWSKWGACSVTCGKGERKRTRKVVRAASCGGKDCSGSNSQTKSCQPTKCCAVNCKVNKWSAWGPCLAPCSANGWRYRKRQVSRQSSCNGNSCPSLSDTQTCRNPSCCPRDCKVSEWSSWSKCSATCGKGTQTRWRSVLGLALCNGKSCPKDLSQQQACTSYNDVNCKVGSFQSDWRTFPQTLILFIDRDPGF